MNQKTGVIGDGRIHLQSWFTHPIMIPNGGLTLYNQLTDDVVKKLP